MNKQKFKENGRSMFPISTDALEFMQQQTFLVARLTELAGSRVIITQPTSTRVGLCVFDGELLPLKGNPSDTRIAIVEVPETIIAHGVPYENARIMREAVYGTSGETASTFVVLDNMVALKSAIADLTTALNTEATTRANHDLPKKAIIDWYGNCMCSQVPDGWVPCGYFFKRAHNQFNPGNDAWIEMEKWKARYADITIEKVGVSSQESAIYISYCNGTSIPNLTDRFIVQAGNAYSLGDAKGQKSVSLKPENLPPHKHEYVKVLTNGEGGTWLAQGNMADHQVRRGTNKTGSGIYDNDGDLVKKSGVAATSFNIIPPYFALYKLIKVI